MPVQVTLSFDDFVSAEEFLARMRANEGVGVPVPEPIPVTAEEPPPAQETDSKADLFAVCNRAGRDFVALGPKQKEEFRQTLMRIGEGRPVSQLDESELTELKDWLVGDDSC